MSTTGVGAPGHLFIERLGAAIRARRLPLDRLSARLSASGTPVSPATLSYWQSGRSLPTRAASLLALEQLELILGVSPGHLSSALPGEQKRWNPYPTLPVSDLVESLINDMGMDPSKRLSGPFLQDSLVIGPDGVLETTTNTQLVRSDVRSLVSSPLAFTQQSEVEDSPAVEVFGAAGLGRVVKVPEKRLTVAEVLFDPPLKYGEFASIGYRVQWLPSDPQQQRNFTRANVNPVKYQVMEATFRCRLPKAIRYLRKAAFESGGVEETVELQIRPRVQVVLTDAKPGIHVIEWDW